MGNLFSALLDTSSKKLEIQQLPLEMILMIFSRVGPEYHGVLRQVCRHWYHIVHGEQIHLARARLNKKKKECLRRRSVCPNSRCVRLSYFGVRPICSGSVCGRSPIAPRNGSKRWSTKHSFVRLWRATTLM